MVNWDKVCIINVAVGRGHEMGQVRLKASLEATRYKGEIMFWNTFPKGSPAHQELPYGFKVYALKEAINKGFELILWLDASVWVNKDITPLIEKIETEGYFLTQNGTPEGGCSTGHWSSDNALKYFEITREAAFKMKHCSGGILGFNLKSDIGIMFSMAWSKSIESFKGDWTNEKKQVSKDDGVLGHRHDQTAASIIAEKLGLTFTDPTGWLDYNVENKDSILLLQGM